MKWYLEVMKKYAVFNGRSTRKEFWTVQVFLWFIIFPLLASGNILVMLIFLVPHISPSVSLMVKKAA